MSLGIHQLVSFAALNPLPGTAGDGPQLTTLNLNACVPVLRAPTERKRQPKQNKNKNKNKKIVFYLSKQRGNKSKRCAWLRILEPLIFK